MNTLRSTGGSFTPCGNQTIFLPSLRVRTIKFGGHGCQLDSKIALTILQYDMGGLFRRFLCLSPSWHRLVLDAMDDYCRPLETDFVMKNYEYLLFKKSYTNSSIINFSGKKGIRVDRVLVCELLENAKLLNKCLRVSYSYQYSSQSQGSLLSNRGGRT